jgi:hypothetical protein
VEKPIGLDALVEAVAILALKERAPSGERPRQGFTPVS